VYFYRMSALSVASDIELPGLTAIPAGGGRAEVTIRRAAVSATLKGASANGPNWLIAGEELLLRIPGVARLLIRSGTDISFEPEGDTLPGDIAIFIVSTAFAILLHQRNQIVLRASAVRVGNRAVIFCGPSGRGKSTIAAALGQRGYPQVGDDVCVIGEDEFGASVIHSDGGRLNLWLDAIHHLGLSRRQCQPVRANLAKFHIQPDEPCAGALRLAAVYALQESRPPLRDGIERAKAVDTAVVVLNSAYHSRLVAALGQKARYFQSAASIAADAGVFFLNRPQDFACMPTVIGWLEEHWRTIELDGVRS
jgi:energy-coupling factor transporter ATP-binding protein EcfA2